MKRITQLLLLSAILLEGEGCTTATRKFAQADPVPGGAALTVGVPVEKTESARKAWYERLWHNLVVGMWDSLGNRY